MTPLPKRRHSSARQAKRTRALKAKFIKLGKCPQCGKSCLPHRVCPSCGFYKGKQVIVQKTKKKNTDSKK